MFYMHKSDIAALSGGPQCKFRIGKIYDDDDYGDDDDIYNNDNNDDDDYDLGFILGSFYFFLNQIFNTNLLYMWV